MLISLPSLDSLHHKVDILADISTEMVQTMGDLNKQTLPSVQSAISSNNSELSSLRESSLKMLEGQTQVIKAQDDLIKGHSELIKTQTELIKAQNLTIDKLVSLIKIVPTPSFTEADRAILSMHTIALISQGALPTNMATLLQRCISAGF